MKYGGGGNTWGKKQRAEKLHVCSELGTHRKARDESKVRRRTKLKRGRETSARQIERNRTQKLPTLFGEGTTPRKSKELKAGGEGLPWHKSGVEREGKQLRGEWALKPEPWEGRKKRPSNDKTTAVGKRGGWVAGINGKQDPC